ncbi:MAG: hypothetical protein K0R54_4826 [Clostridiaceae bacterium]|jgi:uncharacterized membrane protein (DUF485 family)|nr:hypothetical protein [Clostridiaceae bacterium]
MILLGLFTLIGIILGLILKYTLKVKNILNENYTKKISSMVVLISIASMLIGVILNIYVVNANGNFMPADKAVVQKYNLDPVVDEKHRNVYDIPRHPKLINKYYFPMLSLIRKEIYSIGDLIVYFSIAIIIATSILMISIIRNTVKPL